MTERPTASPDAEGTRSRRAREAAKKRRIAQAQDGKPVDRRSDDQQKT